MAAVVASKVKRNRSAKHSNNQGGTIQLEIDRNGKLRKIDRAEEAAAKKRTKLRTTGYYRKIEQLDNDDGVYTASSSANVVLYVGLGMIAIGLVITFVGIGDKGFRTLELKMVGPSLVVFGAFFAFLRILLCTIPSCCKPCSSCCKSGEADTKSLIQSSNNKPGSAKQNGRSGGMSALVIAAAGSANAASATLGGHDNRRVAPSSNGAGGGARSAAEGGELGGLANNIGGNAAPGGTAVTNGRSNGGGGGGIEMGEGRQNFEGELDTQFRHRNIRSASHNETLSGLPNHHPRHSPTAPSDIAVAVTEQPKTANVNGQHIVAPLKMNKPLSYSESDNDSAEEFGAREFAAAEALASKSRIKKVVRPGTWADYAAVPTSLPTLGHQDIMATVAPAQREMVLNASRLQETET